MMIRWVLFFSLFAWSVPVCSADLSALSVSDLIVIGLDKNIGLQVERVNVPISEEVIKIESAIFDAEFFAGANYTEESTPLSFSSVYSLFVSSDTEQMAAQIGLRKKFETGLNATFSLGTERTFDNNLSDELAPRYRSALLLDLTQPLLRNFGSSVNTTQLKLSTNQSRQQSYDYFFRAQDVALRIETLAVRFVSDTEIVTLRQQAVTLANELYLANKRRFDSGVIPVSQVQEAQTDLANRELNLSLAIQAQELSRQQLNRQLDFYLPADFSAVKISRVNSVAETTIELELPDFEQLFTSAKAKRLDLKISELQIKNSRLQKKYFKNLQQPQLDLILQGGLNGLSGKERSPIRPSEFSGSWADSFKSMAAADGYRWKAGLEFSVPLGNRSADARFRQAALQERQANYRKRDLESALKEELLQQSIVLKRSTEQFAIAARFQQLAEISLQQERRRVEEGLSDTFRLILFQNNMINAKIDRINALTLYHLALAQMNFSRGIILEYHGINVKYEAEEASLETI